MAGFTYVLTNASRTVLYVGVTANLAQRLEQHRQGEASAFTRKYHVDRLVYFEQYDRIEDAILREKQIKGKTRAKKVALIETMNPDWTEIDETGGPSLRSG